MNKKNREIDTYILTGQRIKVITVNERVYNGTINSYIKSSTSNFDDGICDWFRVKSDRNTESIWVSAYCIKSVTELEF